MRSIQSQWKNARAEWSASQSRTCWRRSSCGGGRTRRRLGERFFPEAIAKAERLDQSHQAVEREAHHREIIAIDGVDDRRAIALDPVGAGLVHRLPGGDVVVDLVVTDGAKGDAH